MWTPEPNRVTQHLPDILRLTFTRFVCRRHRPTESVTTWKCSNALGRLARCCTRLSFGCSRLPALCCSSVHLEPKHVKAAFSLLPLPMIGLLTTIHVVIGLSSRIQGLSGDIFSFTQNISDLYLSQRHQYILQTLHTNIGILTKRYTSVELTQ